MWNRKSILTAMVFGAMYLQLSGDVIDPDYHVVQRCAFISNLSQFPDIVLIGAYRQTVSSSLSRYIVKNDSCLTKGYKFNRFYLFWVEKSYFEQKGILGIELENLIPSGSAKKMVDDGVAIPVGLMPVSIEPFGGTVSDSIPIYSEKLEYKLTGISGEQGVTVYLAKKVTFDKEGKESVQIFEPTSAVSDFREKSKDQTMVANARIVKGTLMFSLNSNEKISASLFDCRGGIIKRFERTAEAGKQYTVRCDGIAAGVYWLKMKNNQRTVTYRVKSLGGF